MTPEEYEDTKARYERGLAAYDEARNNLDQERIDRIVPRLNLLAVAILEHEYDQPLADIRINVTEIAERQGWRWGAEVEEAEHGQA